MSYSVDANLLLYASDAESPFQRKAVDFLATCRLRPELFCLTWPTLMAYLRIATHPRMFALPLSPSEAQANVEALLAMPRVKVLAEQEVFWSSFRALSEATTTRGNLVPDAHFAAILLEHGVTTLYTRDRDFLKFPGLRAKDPFA